MKRQTDWPLVFVIVISFTLILGSLFVGFVKFMAWWRIAFG